MSLSESHGEFGVDFGRGTTMQRPCAYFFAGAFHFPAAVGRLYLLARLRHSRC
jgi:hypothetical protein